MATRIPPTPQQQGEMPSEPQQRQRGEDRTRITPQPSTEVERPATKAPLIITDWASI